MKPRPGYMSVQEVAKHFGVSQMTVYRLINDGLITAVRVGRSIRIHVDAVADYAEDNEIRIGSLRSWTASPSAGSRARA